MSRHVNASYRLRIFACIVLLGFFAQATAETIDFPYKGSAANGDAPARLVRLTANIRYENRNAGAIANVEHRVTLPATGAEYQALLQIETDGQSVKLEKHKNNEDRYISTSFPLRAKETVEKHVSFLLLLSAVDYSQRLPPLFSKPTPDTVQVYLKPDRQAQSDDKEIVSLASLLSLKCADDLCKVHNAYEFPARHLHFEMQKAPLGAVQALHSGEGDCTEYAALFIAISRAMGIPARRTALFNFVGNTNTAGQPNHDAAEIYVSPLGWVPVDPNLGKGRYDLPEGFAKKSAATIVYKHGDSWTWSNSYAGTAHDFDADRVDVRMRWSLSVLREGTQAEISSAVRDD